MNSKKFKRQCISCREIKSKDELIRLTKDYKTGEIKINLEGEVQGRSLYVCKNLQCLENALKKNKIDKMFKSKLPENHKLELYAVLKN